MGAAVDDLAMEGPFLFCSASSACATWLSLESKQKGEFLAQAFKLPKGSFYLFFLFFSFNYPPFRVYFCSQCSIKKVLFGRNLLGMDLSSSLFFHFCGVCVRYVIALSIKTESIISHRGFPFPEGLSLFFSFSLMFSLFHCLLSFFRFNFVEAFIMSITVLLFF